MEQFKKWAHGKLRWSEQYLKTDMVYLTKSGFWLYSSYAFYTVTAIIISILIGHLIPKDVYGTYTYILSLTSIAGAFSLSGVFSAVTRSIARGYDGSYREGFKAHLKRGVLTFFATAAMGVYYIINDNSQLAQGLFIASIFIPLAQTGSMYGSFFAGKKDFQKNFYFDAITHGTYFLIMAPALFVIQNPVLMVSINLSLHAIVQFVLGFYIYKSIPKEAGAENDIVSYSKHLSVMNIFILIIGQIDKVLVFHYFGSSSLAIYAFATLLPERFRGVMKGVSVLALPKMSERISMGGQPSILSKTLIMSFVSIVLAALYALLAPTIFAILFPQYMSAVPYSQVFALSLVATGSYFSTTSLSAQKATKALYVLNFIFPTTKLLLLFVGIFFWGLWGIILGRVAGAFVETIGGTILTEIINKKRILL